MQGFKEFAPPSPRLSDFISFRSSLPLFWPPASLLFMNTSNMLLPQDFCIRWSLPWDTLLSNVYSSLCLFMYLFCPNVMLSLRSFVPHTTSYYKSRHFLSPFLTYYTFLHNTHHLLIVYIFYSFMLRYDAWCLSEQNVCSVPLLNPQSADQCSALNSTLHFIG